MEDMNILIIDDDPNNSQQMSEMLRKEGYTVYTASGKAEALDYAVKTSPALVFVKAMLLDASGYEVIRDLRTEESLQSTPVVMITEIEKKHDDRYKSIYKIADTVKLPINKDELLAKTKFLLSIENTDEDTGEDMDEGRDEFSDYTVESFSDEFDALEQQRAGKGYQEKKTPAMSYDDEEDTEGLPQEPTREIDMSRHGSRQQGSLPGYTLEESDGDASSFDRAEDIDTFGKPGVSSHPMEDNTSLVGYIKVDESAPFEEEPHEPAGHSGKQAGMERKEEEEDLASLEPDEDEFFGINGKKSKKGLFLGLGIAGLVAAVIVGYVFFPSGDKIKGSFFDSKKMERPAKQQALTSETGQKQEVTQLTPSVTEKYPQAMPGQKIDAEHKVREASKTEPVKPSEPTVEKQVPEKPAVPEKLKSEKPAAEKTAPEKPVAEKTVAEKPVAVKAPVEKKPAPSPAPSVEEHGAATSKPAPEPKEEHHEPVPVKTAKAEPQVAKPHEKSEKTEKPQGAPEKKTDKKTEKKTLAKAEKQRPTVKETASGTYTLQAGMFSILSNADNLAARLKKDGFNAYTKDVSTNGGKARKVFVGSFKSREDALKVQKYLKDKNVESIVRKL